MKKNARRTHKKVVRHIVTYFVCLLLAVLTWTLVMYAEHEEKSGEAESASVYVLTAQENASTLL